MLQNSDMNIPNFGEEQSGASEYLRGAAAACTAGDAVLGMHLYLAAFEQAAAESQQPEEAAVDGLKQAWSLACSLKERALAEYIFEKLEPYLTGEETAAAIEQLQQLALDKLEEFGLSRSDLEDMANAVTSELMGIDNPLVKVRQVIATPHVGMKKKSADASSSESAALAKVAEVAGISTSEPETFTYNDLAGYHSTVQLMRDLGVGMQNDPEFRELVQMLNVRHGVSRMPALDTLLFRSPAREDAERFMNATVGELGLPCLRMRVEETLQGAPVLCVMAHADNMPKLNDARNEFIGRGILVLENLDLWTPPITEADDDFEGFVYAQLSRGAREALNLVRSAVENPDVYVLVSASTEGEIDPFFYEMLEPLTIVDIDYPTPEERIEIWLDIAREHPSMRAINRSDLVRYSANMPRFDMYMAAREALEEAYKESLMARRYVPVTADNLFDKLAAYQPLDSQEYRELENAVVREFAAGLDELNELLEQ